MNLTKRSTLARPIYPNYRTNQLIMLLTIGVGIIFGVISVIQGNGIVDAGVDGFWAAAATIASWIVAREIDPDHEYSAFIGAVIAPFLISQSVGLFAIALLVLFSRLVNHSVGSKVTSMDSIGLTILLGLALFLANPWVLGLIAMFAFLMDTRLDDPHPPHLVFAGIALVITAADAIIQGFGEPSPPDGVRLIGAILVAGVFIATILTTNDITTIPDRGKETPMNTRRVQAAMGLVLLGALLLAIWVGNDGVNDLIPAWAAMAGVAVYRLLKQING